MSDTSSAYSNSSDDEEERNFRPNKSLLSNGEEDLDEGRLNPYEASRLLNTDDLSSDDDEDGGNLNSIGRVPLHWYDAYDHIGYNVAGKKILKRSNGKDKIDIAISNRDDPEFRRTIYDMYNDREIVLSEREFEILRRLQAGAFAHPEHNDTPDYSDYFSSILEVMPIYGNDEPKRRFEVSKWETKRINQIAKAMKEGKYITLEEKRIARKLEREGGDLGGTYLIWNDTEDEVLAETKRHQFHLPAPKMPLPGHAESYNPPPEVMYLFTAFFYYPYAH